MIYVFCNFIYVIRIYLDVFCSQNGANMVCKQAMALYDQDNMIIVGSTKFNDE